MGTIEPGRHRQTGRGLCLSMMVGILACAQPTPRGAQGQADLETALMAADRAFDSTVAARGLEGWVESFGDSGFQITGSPSLVTGHAAIREHMRGLLSDSGVSLRWQPDRAEASPDGQLGYTVGLWTLSRKDSLGTRELATGRYLTVWRRQSDGLWKVEADIGTEASPTGP